MCILTKHEILNLLASGDLEIEPFSENMLEDTEINLRLSSNYAIIKNSDSILDLSSKRSFTKKNIIVDTFYEVLKNDSYIINPHQKVLIESLEFVKLPKNVKARIELRSTFSRLGFMTPPTTIAPGFKGTIMFRLDGSSLPIKIGKNVSIFKITLETTASETNGYNGIYQNQTKITLPRFNDNILG